MVMRKSFFSASAEETMKIGETLGMMLTVGDVVLLEADLAGGKTTLAKGIGLGLGVKKIINSPTFTIVKVYQGRCPLYHLDLYRLNGVNQDFDLEEYFDGDGVVVVEWPYQVKDILPQEYLKIEIFKTGENEREIVFIANSPRYIEMIREMKV